jgi:hypothetical protein
MSTRGINLRPCFLPWSWKSSVLYWKNVSVVLAQILQGIPPGINVIIKRIADRIGREEIILGNLFAVEAREFEKWSAKNGSGIRLSGLGNKPDELALVALFRLIFDESVEFRAAVPGFRNYLLDKSLGILRSGKGPDVLKEIRSDVQVFIEALRPGYDKKLGLIKEYISLMTT